MEREWHRPGLRAGGEGIHLEDVADPEVARLRQGERDIGLIRAAGVGEAAGQDLPPPEGDGDLSGLRGHQRDVGWLRYRVLGQEGLPSDLRKPGQGRLRDVAEHRLADGRCGQQIGCPAPGEEGGVGRIGPAGTRRRGLDGPGEGTNDQCQRQPRPPSLAQLRPQEHPSRVHGRPPRLPPTVPRHPGTAGCTLSAHQECVGRWPLRCPLLRHPVPPGGKGASTKGVVVAAPPAGCGRAPSPRLDTLPILGAMCHVPDHHTRTA